MRKLLLASSSKWRRMVLEETLAEYSQRPGNESLQGIVVEQWAPDIDEKAIRSPVPSELVLMVGRAKLEAAKAAFLRCSDTNETEFPQAIGLPEWILAGDQVSIYYCKGETDPMLAESLDRYIDKATSSPPSIILEKPETTDENRLFLRSYRNYSVTTIASQVLYHVPTKRTFEGIDKNTVYFGDIPESVIEGLIARGDSMFCCGGFVVEDVELSGCITRIEGSVQGVQGLGPALMCNLMDQSLRKESRGTI